MTAESFSHAPHTGDYTRDTGSQTADTSPQPSRGNGDSPPPSTGRHDGAAGGSLTRITANFTPRAMAALEKVAAETGDSKTDILNRSVMVYEVFLELMQRSEGTLRVVYPDGSQERLRFLG